MQERRNTIYRLSTIAVLIAANVVLARFLSISLWNLKIGFGFVPVVLAGMLLGPLGGAITGALGDFIGAVAFPIGPYFPGFTLTAFGTGLWYGLMLRGGGSAKLSRILWAVLVTEVLGSVLMNTYWIHVVYHTPFQALLPVRLGQAAVMGVVEVVVIRVLEQVLPRVKGSIQV